MNILYQNLINGGVFIQTSKVRVRIKNVLKLRFFKYNKMIRGFIFLSHLGIGSYPLPLINYL